MRSRFSLRWFACEGLALVALALAALPAPLPAQTAAGDLVVQNLAPHARTEWCAAVVPFARGEVATAATPDLHAAGHATVWVPLGARWPDGSLRHAMCLFRPTLDALGERRLDLAPGAGPTLDGPAPTLPPELAISFLWQHGERHAEVELTSAGVLEDSVLEASAARRVMLWRARIGETGLVAEVILTAWRGQEHVDASVGVFFSDPRIPALDCPIDRLAVRTRGLALVLRHAGRFGTRALITPTGDGSETTLLRGCRLGDGQGIRRVGVLVPKLRGGTDARDATLRAAVTCPLLAATARWQPTGTWGAFGVVPSAPPALQTEAALRAVLAKRHAALAFTTDPTIRSTPATWHGRLHDLSFVLLGLTLFPSMIVLGFVFQQNGSWKKFSLYTWLTVACAIPAFILKGAAFYVFLLAILFWMETLAWKLNFSPAGATRP